MLPQFTLVEHLTEIRKRLIKTLIAFIAIFIYMFTQRQINSSILFWIWQPKLILYTRNPKSF